MTRKLALKHLKVAFLEGDKAKATRIYIENRISMAVYKQYAKKYMVNKGD